MYNKLLDHQLQQHSVKPGMVPGYLIPVLQLVSDLYDHYEMNGRLGGHAIDINYNKTAEPCNNGYFDNDEKLSNIEKDFPFQYDEKEKYCILVNQLTQ